MSVDQILLMDVVKMKESSRITVLLFVSLSVAATFIYLGSLMKYPDNIIVGAAGVIFALVFSLVLYFNTNTAAY